MNEEEIKTLRHSFTSKEDASKISKNQFGHTILGDTKNIDTSKIEVKFNEYGEISAESTQSLLDSPELLNLTNFTSKNEVEVKDQPNTMINKIANNVAIKDLISALDKMDGSNESPNIHPLTGFQKQTDFFIK